MNGAFDPAKGTPRVVSPLGELFLPLEGLIDVPAEKARLEKELAKIESEIDKASQKLANPNFAQNAPPTVLKEHQQRLADWNAKHGACEMCDRGIGMIGVERKRAVPRAMPSRRHFVAT